MISALWKQIFKNYIWIPKEPLCNRQPVKQISEYPNNPEFDYNSHDFTGKYISGESSFIQTVQKFILTERYKYMIYADNYGTEEAAVIFSVKNTDEFSRQCNNIAIHLIETYPDWIQEIYKIHRKKNKLIIEMKVKGKPDTLICVVPNTKKKAGINN